MNNKEEKNNIYQEFLIKIQQLISILNDIDEIIESQQERQQEADLLLCDYLHLLENEEFGSVLSSNIGQKIKEARIERRHWKNIYIVAGVYLRNKGKLIQKNQRDAFEEEIKKTVESLNQSYHYRILNAEEIKKLHEEKKKKNNDIKPFVETPVKKSKRKKLTKQWLEDQLKTKSGADIARELGVTPGTISNAKKRFGLEVRKKRHN